MRLEHRSAVVLSAILLCTCTATHVGSPDAGGPMSADSGVDAFFRARDARGPEDARMSDAERVTDAELLDTGEPLDPRDWRPAFAPRVIYENPDVRCAALPMDYSPPARSPTARGGVRWTYRPAADPRAVARFAAMGLTDFFIDAYPFMATANGGVVVLAGYERDRVIVDHQGEFVGATSGIVSTNRMWIRGPDQTLVDQSEPGMSAHMQVLDGRDGSYGGIPSEAPGALPAFPGASWPSGPTGGQMPDPALMPDGTILWAPTTSSLVASCVLDGRTRWILEHDPSGWHQSRSIFATQDGEIIFAGTATYRIDGEGTVLATRVAVDVNDAGLPVPHATIAWSQRCGLSRAIFEPETLALDGIEYWSGADFTDVRELRFPGSGVRGGQPTSDCAALVSTLSAGSFVVERVAPDGGTVFRRTLPPGHSSITAIELSDGGFLFVQNGDPAPPAVTVYDTDGEIELEAALDPDVVGMRFTHGAFMLTPDGTLYVASTSGLDERQQIVAIEIGVGATTPYPGSLEFRAGMNWARTNSAWHD
ncbi:MAG: hypothetical protein M3Y87_10760 [Myxococcota bacterium]|nr:hypothetical protein [Myxococcota bacterium]